MATSTEPTHDGVAQDRGPDFLELVARREPGEVVADRAAEIATALERGLEGREVVWLQGQSCSGCTMSLLQSDHPEIEATLSRLRESTSFHTELMTPAGEGAMARIDAPDVLVVEGSIPTTIPRAATLGTDEHGRPKPVLDWVLELAAEAEVVLAAGSCAAFGGLPAAGRYDSADVGESPTGARGVGFDGEEAGGVLGPDFRSGRELPVINVSGCPIHPDHLLVTLATVLNGHEPALDGYNRPLPLFEPLAHDDCELREEYECGEFAAEPGDDGCLYDAGCAGVYAHCDGSERLRNGTTVCRNVGAPCVGCTEPAFWDRFSPFYEDGRDDDGQRGDAPRSVGAERSTDDVGMTTLGRLVAATVAAFMSVPLAVATGLGWLHDRVAGDGPVSWGE